MGLMDKMIELLVVVLFFSAIIGTIATQVRDVENVTGAALTLYGLLTLIIIAGFVTFVYKRGFKGGK